MDRGKRKRDEKEEMLGVDRVGRGREMRRRKGGSRQWEEEER